MKKIINKKLYDTDTATLVADEEISLRDFYRTSESLYITDNGNWFVHAESSAGGTYSTQGQGDDCGPGETIIAIDAEDVLDWAETHRISSEECNDIVARLKNVELA